MTTIMDTPAKPILPVKPDDDGTEILWQPRVVSAERSVGQYTRFVGRMKIVLPAVASAILLLVLLLPQLRRENANLKISVKSVGQATSDTLAMMNARYYGVDQQGRPYFIRAAQAHQRAENSNMYDLTSPHGELTMSDGNVVTLDAATGVYDRGAQLLDLSGQVHVEDKRGRVFDTTRAHILLKEKTASGDAPVTGHGSFGNIEAAGFTMRDEDKNINFVGPVHLVLNRNKSEGNASAAPAPASAAGPAPVLGTKK